MRLPWRPALLAVVLALTGVASDPGPVEAGYTFVWPTKGRITQPFGCTGFSWEPRRGSCRHFHSGIDIANGAGTPIRAATSGVVKLVGYNPYDQPGQRAWIVVIKHDAGFTGWYAHMQPKYVSGVRAGRRVSTGQLIGYMGNTGRSTGVHLHFAFFKSGNPVNPKNYLPPWRSTSGSTGTTTTTTTTRTKQDDRSGRTGSRTKPVNPPPAAPEAPAAEPDFGLLIDYSWFHHDHDHDGTEFFLLYHDLFGYRAPSRPIRV